MSFVTVRSALLVAAAFVVAAPAVAANVELDISGSFNLSLNNNYTLGGSYPGAGSTVTIGAVDFQLGAYNGTAGTVTTTYSGTPSTVSIDIADVANVTRLYTLINSAYGSNGASVGFLDLNFSNDTTYSYELIEGINIRDHFAGGYNNVSGDLYGTASYADSALRLDAQEIILPAQFQGLTLTSLKLRNTTPDGRGNPFLVAVTAITGADAVPEPASWAMMLGGFGMVGATLRRRRAAFA